MTHHYIKYLSLVSAIRSGRIDSVKLYISEGVNVNYTDNRYEPPLVIATYYGRDKIVKLLIRKGANIDCDNETTLLLITIQRKYTKMVKFFISKGVDVNKANYYGVVPIDVALFRGYIDVIKMILNTLMYN